MYPLYFSNFQLVIFSFSASFVLSFEISAPPFVESAAYSRIQHIPMAVKCQHNRHRFVHKLR